MRGDAAAAKSVSKMASQAPSLLMVRSLVQTLHDPSAQVRSQGALALTSFTPVPAQVINELLQMAQSRSQLVRVTAIESLARLGHPSPEHRTIVLDALKSKEKNVRMRAAEALGHMSHGEAHVIQALCEGLLDKEPLVRRSCAQALIHIGRRLPSQQDSIAQALMEFLNEPVSEENDPFNNSTSEIAFWGLWCLVTGSEATEWKNNDFEED